MDQISSSIVIKSKKFGTFQVLFDSEDYNTIKKYNWCIKLGKGTFYVFTNINIENKRTTRMMHNIITGFKYVDHINGIGFDNRRSNLREVNNTENCYNRQRPCRKNKSSKYKGVDWSKEKKKWRARIKYKRQISLGYFNTEIEAAEAYNNAAKLYFKEHAFLNKIER